MLGNLLTESSRRYPEKIAIKDRKEQISYAELEEYSNKIASYLISKGLKIGDRVGLYINKSIGGIATIFGILKAGCVYVPLDINWPPKRCAYIVENCQIKLLFSHSNYTNRVSEISKLSTSLKETIFLDKGYSSIYSIQLKDLPLVDKDSLAIILYTSGSTGKPKGVMRTHRVEINDLKRAQDCYRIAKNDRYALYHSLSFSPGTEDTLLMIECAGTICILPEGISAFAISLKEFLKKEKITVSHLGPEVIISLVLYGNLKRGELPNLKKIMIVGGRLPIDYLRSIMKVLPKTKFLYLYGATEAIMVTSYTLRKIPSKKETYLPIGKPPKGIQTYIVDEKGQKLEKKPGAMGELYVSSDSLMSGYWNDPDATKEVLFKDPFSKKQRLVYRTHDLMKIDRHRNYIFIGRIDNVIKTRGFRVSLDEIEAVLEKHPKVKEVVCLGIPDEEMGSRIKAIMVLKDREEVSENQIKSFCREYLATYMVPEIIEFRSSLPRLTSGKIDRGSLLKGGAV